MAYVKLDTALLNSTLWVDRECREVFLTALLMAEPHEVVEPMPQIAVRTLDLTGFVVPPGWYGFVHAAGSGIVRMALTEDSDAGLSALERLGDIDPESRSPEFDGRRLVRVNGGFIVLNYMKFRDKDHTAAQRSQRYRERLKSRKASPVTRDGVDDTRSVTQAESIVHSAKAEKNNNTTSGLPEFLSRLPENSRQAVEQMARAQRNPLAWVASISAMLDGMGTAGGKAVTPEELGVALTELAATDARPSPATVRTFIARLRKDAATLPSDGQTRLQRLEALTPDITAFNAGRQ